MLLNLSYTPCLHDASVGTRFIKIRLHGRFRSLITSQPPPLEPGDSHLPHQHIRTFPSQVEVLLPSFLRNTGKPSLRIPHPIGKTAIGHVMSQQRFVPALVDIVGPSVGEIVLPRDRPFLLGAAVQVVDCESRLARPLELGRHIAVGCVKDDSLGRWAHGVDFVVDVVG